MGVMFMALFTNFYIQAYTKRRRLPNVKKDDDATQTKAVQDKDCSSKDKNKAAQAGITSIFSRIFNNAAAACYIGQNPLRTPLPAQERWPKRTRLISFAGLLIKANKMC